MQQLACIYSFSIRVMIFCCLLAGWFTATSQACKYNHLLPQPYLYSIMRLPIPPQLFNLAPWAGLEPATKRLLVTCSNQLSYQGIIFGRDRRNRTFNIGIKILCDTVSPYPNKFKLLKILVGGTGLEPVTESYLGSALARYRLASLPLS